MTSDSTLVTTLDGDDTPPTYLVVTYDSGEGYGNVALVVDTKATFSSERLLIEEAYLNSARFWVLNDGDKLPKVGSRVLCTAWAKAQDVWTLLGEKKDA